MKALSLKQPWADLILNGHKTIETRTWGTSYRGDLLICSSKQFDRNFEYSMAGKFPFKFVDSIRGHALCIAKLMDCRLMTGEDERAACCKIYPGAFAWILADIRKIKPFPVKGQLGLFEIELAEDAGEKNDGPEIL